MTNGRYQSCLHRTVVNSDISRKSLVFFLSPEKDRMVAPPEELVDADHPRLYPDFLYGELLEFTLKHYRVDTKTLDAFSQHILKKKEGSSVCI